MYFLKTTGIITIVTSTLFLSSCFNGLDELVGNAPPSPSLSATADADSREGYVSFTLEIIPPSDTKIIDKYEVFWGNSSHLQVSRVCSFNKNEQTLKYTLPEGTQIPDDVSYFIVYSVSDENIKSEPSSFLINDFSMNSPGLEFLVDSDRDEDQIGGFLKLIAPVKVDEIERYRVYIGTPVNPKSVFLNDIMKNNNPLEIFIPDNTDIPDGATHFAVYSIAHDGRESVPEFLDIDDMVLKKAADVNIGPSPFGQTSQHYMTVYNGNLYFNADGGTGNGAELWKYNETNIELVADINSGIDGSYPSHLCVYNNKLYFNANGGDSTGRELWSFDGNSVSRISDIYPGSSDSSPSFLTVYNNQLYFSAYTAYSISKLFSYNGTGSPLKVSDINAAGTSDSISHLVYFNNKLHFKAKKSGELSGLWSYDGTSITRIAEINVPVISKETPEYPVVFNNDLYFCGIRNDNAGNNNGVELWSYDGVNQPSEKYDIYPGTTSSDPKYMTTYNGKLYFQAYASGKGNEFWCYDGNKCYLVADINNSSSSSYPECFTVYNGKLYFKAEAPSINKRLWVFYIK
jgi:ELWxxDGT repeat protein